MRRGGCSAPVRSRPAPRIMVAMMLITALPEKPSKTVPRPAPGRSGRAPPAPPARRRRLRMRSNMNIAIVKHDQPEHEHHVAGQGQVGVHVRCQSSSAPAVVNQVPDAVARASGRAFRNGSAGATSGRGTEPRGPARVAQSRRRHRAHPTSARRSPASRWPGASGRRARACRSSRLTNAGLDQATLVVALLVPGVRESRCALRPAHASAISFSQHLDRIVVVDAHVGRRRPRPVH